MKKAIAIVVSLIFIFALTAVSFAAEKAAAPAEKKEAAPAEKKEPAKKAATKQVTGEVTAVDAKAKTITVKGKKGDVVITVDDKTLADVKAGDKVTAKYTEADGKNTAKSVKKAEAKAEEKKAPAEKKEAAPKAEEKKAAPAKKPAGGY